MAGKSRVGALYFEMVLDPSKYEKGSRKVISEDNKRVKKMLANAHKQADSKAVLDKQLVEYKRVIKEKLKAGEIGWDKAKQLQAIGIASHKAGLKKIETNERLSAKRRTVRAKRAQDKIVNDAQAHANKMVATEQAEQKRLDAKYQAYLRKRHIIQRKWNKRRNDNERKAAQQRAAIQKSAFAGGLFGSGAAMQGLGKLTAGFAAVTSALFPLAIAGYAALRMFKALARGMMAVITAADEKKKQMIVLTKLMNDNEGAAVRLREKLVAYAKATAFSVKETTDLAIAMRALGFEGKEIPKIMAQLGRLSFGDGGKLKLIAKAYSDVKAQGKLLMTEVRQFANQGVPLLAQLQLNLGKTALETRDMMKNGLIGFEEVEKAVADIASSYGSVDTAGLSTLTGQLDAAGEAWGEVMAKIGRSESLVFFGEILNSVINGIDKLVSTLDGSESAIDRWFNRFSMFGGIKRFLDATVWREKRLLEQYQEQSKELKKQERILLARANAKQAYLAYGDVAREEQDKVSREQIKVEAKTNDARNGTNTLEALEEKWARADALVEAHAKLQESRQKELAALQKADDAMVSDAWIAAERASIEARYKMQKEFLDKSIKEMQQAEDAAAAAKKAQEDREAAEKLKKEKKAAREKRRREKVAEAKKEADEAIKRSKHKVEMFDKMQAEEEKLRGMSPKNAAVFSAGSVEEHQFMKDRENKKADRQFELKMEAERQQFIQDENVILANNIADAIVNAGIANQAEDTAELFETVE